MQKIKKYIPITLSLTPLFVLAYDVIDIPTLLTAIGDILTMIVPLLVAVAVVWFLWGVVQYVTAGGDDEKRKKGRNTMMWGIVVLFVMISVWGLVWILLNTFVMDYTPVYPIL